MCRKAMNTQCVPNGQIVPAGKCKRKKRPRQAHCIQHLLQQFVWLYSVSCYEKNVDAAQVQRQKRGPEVPAIYGYAIFEQFIAYQEHRQHIALPSQTICPGQKWEKPGASGGKVYSVSQKYEVSIFHTHMGIVAPQFMCILASQSINIQCLRAAAELSPYDLSPGIWIISDNLSHSGH